MTTQFFGCRKHFEESDFVYHTNDTNNRRKWKRKRKSLNTDMSNRKRIQQNIQTVLHNFQKRSLLKDLFQVSQTKE